MKRRFRAAGTSSSASPRGTQLFDNATGVTAQLFEQNGDCYETAFTPAQVLENGGAQFTAMK